MITLIRYDNRKIYDPRMGAKRYITSDDILSLIFTNDKFRVVAYRSGLDVTRPCLINMGARLLTKGSVEQANTLINYAEGLV